MAKYESYENLIHKLTLESEPVKLTDSQILRGEKIPVKLRSRLSNEDEKRSMMEGMLSSLNPSLFKQSIYRMHYYRSTELDGEQWCLKEKHFNDNNDISIHPSYDIKLFQYDLSCYLRYLEASEAYERQFQREIKHFIETRRSICDQYFAKSLFVYTSLWPPLHTKKELDRFERNFFQVTPEQRKRLNYLLKTDLSKSQ